MYSFMLIYWLIVIKHISLPEWLGYNDEQKQLLINEYIDIVKG